MTRVFNEYSRLQIPVTEIESLTEDDSDLIDLPAGIQSIESKTVNERLRICSVADDGAVERYTPTAVVKGGYEDRRVVFDEQEGCTHKSVSDYRSGGWKEYDDDELDTQSVEYLNISGHGDSFLVHNELRAEMFHVTCQLATVATKGFIQGVLVEDGELNAVRYEAGGQTTDVEVDIVESDHPEQGETTDETDESVEWAQY